MRKKNNDAQETPLGMEAAPVESESQKKGRPTPTRKEAEAQRMRSIVPADRKEARRREKAARAERYRIEQKALKTGDERNMPLQDQGDIRKYVRNLIDVRRISFVEYIFPLMVIMLVTMMATSGLAKRNPSYSVIGLTISVFFYLLFIICFIEVFIVWRSMKKKIQIKYPNKPIPRGTMTYALSRMTRLRPWRLPRPVVKRGEKLK